MHNLRGPSVAFNFDGPIAPTFRELAATAFGGQGGRLRAAAREAETVNWKHAGFRAEISEATGRHRQLTARSRPAAYRPIPALRVTREPTVAVSVWQRAVAQRRCRPGSTRRDHAMRDTVSGRVIHQAMQFFVGLVARWNRPGRSAVLQGWCKRSAVGT